MADPIMVVLGGLVVAFTSGTIGKYLGNSGKVKETQCEERRSNCISLVSEKIDNLTDRVSEMKRAIDKLSNSKIV